jgi:hypothetical protein
MLGFTFENVVLFPVLFPAFAFDTRQTSPISGTVILILNGQNYFSCRG